MIIGNHLQFQKYNSYQIQFQIFAICYSIQYVGYTIICGKKVLFLEPFVGSFVC